MTRTMRLNRRRVYFIKPIGMDGPIKIGCSCSPEKRRDALESWAPFPLEIIAEIAGDFELEQRFHAKFESSHERREWFAVTPELEATISAICASRFDIETLPPPKMLPRRNGRRSRVRTAEERLRQSYSNRVAHMRKRSGFAPPFSVKDIVTQGRTFLADQYLAEPHVHGIAHDNPWDAKRREEWVRNLLGEAA